MMKRKDIEMLLHNIDEALERVDDELNGKEEITDDELKGCIVVVFKYGYNINLLKVDNGNAILNSLANMYRLVYCN